MWHDWCHPGLCIASGQRSAITGTVHPIGTIRIRLPCVTATGRTLAGSTSRLVGCAAAGAGAGLSSEPNHTSRPGTAHGTPVAVHCVRHFSHGDRTERRADRRSGAITVK